MTGHGLGSRQFPEHGRKIKLQQQSTASCDIPEDTTAGDFCRHDPGFALDCIFSVFIESPMRRVPVAAERTCSRTRPFGSGRDAMSGPALTAPLPGAEMQA
ncbi:hypothetical protein AB4Z01_30530 [Inquilinus sp. YAF38]|uniref:hypothetical protein n=1 Tax=Inquilinus sp. YAF38 TaxID=3233084 RepID=UPI003F91C25C